MSSPLSIKTRVALTTFLVLALSLGVAAFAVDEATQKIALASLDRQLESDVHVLSSLVGFDDGKFEFEGADTGIPGFAEKGSGVYYVVTIDDKAYPSRSLGDDHFRGTQEPDHTTASGVEIFSFTDLPRESAPGIVPEGGRMAIRGFTLTVGEKGERSAKVSVRVIRSLAPVLEARRTVERALAVALPLALLLGTLGAFVVAARATRPIARMTEEARAIEPATLEKRLDVQSLEGELRELALTLNAAFDRLADGIARERRLSADASHELRTPIAILRGKSELALTRERSSEEYRAALASNVEAAIRLEKIVESLLLLARGQAGKLVEQGERVDLAQVAERAVSAAREPARAASLELELAAPSPVAVAGSAALLERLVSNLVENALRHGSDGKKIQVEVATRNGDALVFVRDHGKGVPPAEAERIFRPFVRLDESRERAKGGAGLGLALVRTIARAHAGEATVEPTQGGGATFRVRLPLAPPAPASPEPKSVVSSQ